LIQISKTQSKAGAYTAQALPPGDPLIAWQDKFKNHAPYKRQRVYLSEARRIGLIVRPPHVNYSQHNFSVRTLDAILFPEVRLLDSSKLF
jgi:hypothetical protein